MLEGVWPVFSFLSDIVENVSSESGELVAQKEVGEKDLHNAVNERQDLHSKKPVMKTILAIIMLTFSRSFMGILNEYYSLPNAHIQSVCSVYYALILVIFV